jgi:predicted HAD superfamily Cof-like phosphohydrolase
MKSEHQQRVEEFMRKAGQDVPPVPFVPGEETLILRAKLIMEEALETINAMGVFPYGLDGDEIQMSSIEFHADEEPNLIEVIDGCCDISVVTTGTLSAFGIPDAPFLKLIDESNLAKFAEGSYRREDGKWMKPPGWQAPDIEGLLKRIS